MQSRVFSCENDFAGFEPVPDLTYRRYLEAFCMAKDMQRVYEDTDDISFLATILEGEGFIPYNRLSLWELENEYRSESREGKIPPIGEEAYSIFDRCFRQIIGEAAMAYFEQSEAENRDELPSFSPGMRVMIVRDGSSVLKGTVAGIGNRKVKGKEALDITLDLDGATAPFPVENLRRLYPVCHLFPGMAYHQHVLDKASKALAEYDPDFLRDRIVEACKASAGKRGTAPASAQAHDYERRFWSDLYNAIECGLTSVGQIEFLDPKGEET